MADEDRHPRSRGDTAFSEVRRLIEWRLDRQDVDLKNLQATVDRIEVELISLKIRAGLWGAIAGALPMLLAAVAFYLWKAAGS